MGINSKKTNKTCLEVIFRFLELGGIDDHCCLEQVACFLDIGGIDDHCCFEVIAY
jgi:hypothetical protein